MIATTKVYNYFDFCSDNFPNSYWNSDIKRNKKIDFFININKSIELLMLIKGINLISDNSKDLMSDCENYLKRVLYCAPINDKMIYSSVMRGLSESLLRTVYSSIFPEETCNKIRSIQYRSLNDEIRGHPILSTIMSTEVNKILNFYGIYSNDIHNKKGSNSNNIRFLSDILTSQSGINPDKLSSDSQSILEFCQKVLFFAFNITDKTLSHTEKSKLEEILK